MRSKKIAAAAAALVLAVPLAVQAQTYRCSAKDGKKYYGSTIPTQCIGRRVEQLKSQGFVVRRMDPDADEKQRIEQEATRAKKTEAENTNREETRRHQALLATYTSERDIQDSRSRAL